MAVTIYDVARKAGVSAATVSRVMNKAGAVAADLRAKVEAAMRELDYRPNRLARRMRSPAANMWALIVPDFENSFFTQLARGIEDVSLSHGNFVMLGNSDFDRARERAYIELAVAENVSGVVIAPAFADSDLDGLVKAGVPMVVVNRHLPHVAADTVISDNRTGGRIAAKLFHERGFQRIACLDGSPPGERQAGFRGYLANYGATAEVLSISADYRARGAYQAMRELLAGPDRPRAVFVTNNMMSYGAIQACHEAGIRIPEDIALIGFDVDAAFTLTGPAITSVNQDARMMGQMAAERLLARQIDRDAALQTLMLAPHLVLGATV
jgi:LacI family transcriptional regulator